MLTLPFRWVFSVAMALASTTVGAQPSPKDLGSLSYRSALAEYRKFDEQPVAPWGEVNAIVAAIGGWRVYAREARPPAAEGKAAPATTGTSKPDGSSGAKDPHAGHGAKP